MKTQLQRPSAGKASYTPEYKQQALEQWRLSCRSAARVASELGIRAPLLYRWARQKRVTAAAAGELEFTKPEIERMDAADWKGSGRYLLILPFRRRPASLNNLLRG